MFLIRYKLTHEQNVLRGFQWIFPTWTLLTPKPLSSSLPSDWSRGRAISWHLCRSASTRHCKMSARSRLGSSLQHNYSLHIFTSQLVSGPTRYIYPSKNYFILTMRHSFGIRGERCHTAPSGYALFFELFLLIWDLRFPGRWLWRIQSSGI